MSTENRPTVREIDKTLAMVLRRIRVLEREVPHRLKPRTRPFGPHSFRRSSAGQLVTAALAGLAVGRWGQGLNLPEERFFEAELKRRGFESSLLAWRGDDVQEDRETVMLGTDRFDQHADRSGLLTVSGLAGMASALDQVFLAGDGHVPSALSPAELIEDMHAVGLHPAAAEAYEGGVGSSETAITEELTYLTENGESPATFDSEASAEDVIIL